MRLYTRRTQPLPLWLLVLICMLPWGLVTLGLYFIEDFRAAVGLYEGLCCLIPAYVLSRNRDIFRFSDFNIQSLRSVWLWILILTGNVLIIGGYLLFEDSFFIWDQFLIRVQGIGLEFNEVFWVFALYFVTINPLIEELFWRGFIYQEFKEYLPQPWALAISSLFFGSWHWVIIHHYFSPLWTIISTLGVVLGGIAFGLVYEKSKSLLPPIVLHGLGGDVPIIVIFYMAMIRSQGHS